MISTNRLEAFSDGIIAIIITIMVFDLKLQQIVSQENLWSELRVFAPKFLSYLLSFITIAIMWISHHQLFHQIREIDRKMLWFNLNLLFWMSLIPFVTGILGTATFFAPAVFAYGFIMFMNAFGFTVLRTYVSSRSSLLKESISPGSMKKIRKKNYVAMGLYLFSALSAFASVYISFLIFAVVPAMYFIPEKIHHQTTS